MEIQKKNQFHGCKNFDCVVSLVKIFSTKNEQMQKSVQIFCRLNRIRIAFLF